MNKLPKYWIVKNDGSQLFKDTVIKYLNNIYKDWLGDCKENYYGFDGNNSYNGTTNHCNINFFENNPTLLTLNDFIELSKEEFILPEKWCIKTNSEIDKVLINWRGGGYDCPMKEAVLLSDKYWISSRHSFSDYTEITFEQFKKYVLKQTDMKKIKYYKILKKVWGLRGIEFLVGSRLDIRNKESLPYFESLGILNDTTIFEPVYEEEFKVGDVVYIKEAQKGAYGANNSFGIITDEKISAGINELLSLRVNIKGSVWGIGDPDKCNIRLATKEEVENYENSLLLEEAKKRYPVGTKFKPAHMLHDPANNYCIVTNNTFKINTRQSQKFAITAMTDEDNYFDSGKKYGSVAWDRIVYTNGKWAEILPSFPDITINGYKAKFSEDFVEFGCAKISKELFIELNESRALSNVHDYGNKEVTSITIGAGTFTKDQIKQIAEYYNG